MQPQTMKPVVKSTPGFVTNTNIAEDLWSGQSTPAATKNKKNPIAIAIKKQQTTATITAIHPKQSVKVHTSSPKQSVAANRQVSEVVPTGLAKMTVAQMRLLCCQRNIKWRNAHGSKHLTKAEMQGTAECLISTTRPRYKYLGCKLI